MVYKVNKINNPSDTTEKRLNIPTPIWLYRHKVFDEVFEVIYYHGGNYYQILEYMGLIGKPSFISEHIQSDYTIKVFTKKDVKYLPVGGYLIWSSRHGLDVVSTSTLNHDFEAVEVKK